MKQSKRKPFVICPQLPIQCSNYEAGKFSLLKHFQLVKTVEVFSLLYGLSFVPKYLLCHQILMVWG